MNISDFRKDYPEYDDLTDETVASYLHMSFYPDVPVEDFAVTFLGKHDPLEGSGRYDKFMIGAGKSMTDIGLGTRQILGQAGAEEALDKAEIDSAIMDTGWGKTGAVVGGVSTAAPAMLIPGANSAVGATLVGAGYGALQPTTNDDIVEGKLINSAIGGAFGYGGHQLGSAVANQINKLANNRAASAAAAQAQNRVRDQAARESMEAGYTIPPTQANPSVVNKIMEGIPAKTTTAQQASLANQSVTNGLATQALGLTEDAPLTESTFQAIRKVAGEAYDAIPKAMPRMAVDEQYVDDLVRLSSQAKQLGDDFPSLSGNVDDVLDDFVKDSWKTDNAMKAIKVLRERAKNLYRSGSVEDVELAQLNKSIATAMEELMERRLASTNSHDLVRQFQDARRLFARSYAVEDAVNVGTGEVSAASLGRELAKGAPLTDELRQIGMFQQAFPRAAQNINSSMTEINPMDLAAAGTASVTTGNPALMGTALTRPIARNIVLSKPYQSILGGTPDYKPAPLLGATNRIADSDAAKAISPLAALVSYFEEKKSLDPAVR